MCGAEVVGVEPDIFGPAVRYEILVSIGVSFVVCADVLIL